MAARPSPLRYGRIVYAWIEDTRGFAKLRPALALTPDALLGRGDSIVVAAITTTFGDPPPAGHVALPWHPRGITATRLKARSAVVTTWQAIIEADDIVGFGGDVPTATMLRIEDQLDELIGD